MQGKAEQLSTCSMATCSNCTPVLHAPLMSLEAAWLKERSADLLH